MLKNYETPKLTTLGNVESITLHRRKIDAPGDLGGWGKKPECPPDRCPPPGGGGDLSGDVN